MLQNLTDLLKTNPYPGRGIVLGRSACGAQGYIAYFIMGRSPNSRNRVFEEKDGGIVTQAANPALMTDPSLVIYAPVRKAGADTVVTNGDQTDTIVDFLAQGKRFEDALETRTFEPDAPNYTPRISGIFSLRLDGFEYKLSVLKSAGGSPNAVQRFTYSYPQPLAGQGHFLHTYAGDGNPLPSFAGEPVAVALPDGSLKAFGDGLWEALDAENKVSLFVRSLALDGAENTLIYNKYSKI